jgi:hypothetical protein
VRAYWAFAVITFAASSSVVGAVPPSPADIDYFEQKVRPLLVTHCYECHSAESKILQGGLLLDSRPGWQKGGDSGEVIVPSKPDESLLVRALRYDKNEYVHMPPKGKLPEAEIAVFVEWIKRGAPDPRDKGPTSAGPAKRVIDIAEGKKHWAFQPLAKPTPPAVKNESWCRTPVDRFILAQLEKAGLAPNAVASEQVLTRRAAFDLVGLPPANIPPSPRPSISPSGDNDRGTVSKGSGANTYEAQVDDLLASPHYGERWGRHWLDLARFAESHGFEQDYDRPNAYHYRDFVIRALNDDLPYDTFVKWQIAGDEYEPENPQALMATGFLAAGVHATQITANQAEKERYDELDDMARTIGTTMLGLTVGCARCHDHKYDPITNADYFRIASTFTTTVRSDFDVNLKPDEHKAAMSEWEPGHKPIAEALARHEATVVRPAFDKWLAARAEKRHAPTWIVPQKIEVSSGAPVKFEVQADGSVTARGTQFMPAQYKITVDTKLTGITALRVEAFRDDALPHGGPGMSPTGGFQISSIKTNAVPVRKGTPVDGKIIRQTTANGDKTEAADAWAVTAPAGENHTAAFAFEKPLGFEGGTKLTFTVAFGGNYGGIGRFRIALARDEKPALASDVVGEAALAAWEALAADPKKTPTKEERDALFAWFRSQDPAWRKASAAVEASLAQKPKPEIAKVLISSEGVPAVRLHTQGPDFYEKTFVVRRGDPNQKVEEATPGFLDVLVADRKHEADWRTAPPAGTKTTYRRRALSEWMTDVDHGAGALLARVIVNRLWYYHFGRGLVNTPSDFGLQGERPSHPELLDYLAGELIRNRWRLKPIHKLIMTSAVYMQTGESDPKRIKADPENRLFWHKPMRRLEGEIVRDAMMASAGVLDTRMFGPGTLDPAQPRRSIYFFIKRTKLIPMMSLFDGPDTLQDLAVRPETTVAPQALLLMNSPIVRGYAAALAERIGRESPSADLPSRVEAAYRLTLSRAPSVDEVADTLAFVEGQRAAYVSEGKAADAEKLAWADFCQVLFGLNEFTYIP